MHRSACILAGGLASAAMLFGSILDPAPARAGNHPIERQDGVDRYERAQPPEGPIEGIRGFGKGAVRPVLAPAAKNDPAYAAAGSIDVPPADLLLNTKISGTPMAGSVTAFSLTPAGTRAVFIADKDVVGRFELFSVPVNGSTAPVKISAGIPLGAGDTGVSAFQITPDSARVVFLADARLGGKVDDIYSVPIDASAAPVQLNAAGAAPVIGLGITANSATAVFFGKDTSFGSGRVEMYRAAIGTASSGVQISRASQSNAQGNVVAAEFSPDSSRVVYAADASVDGVFQWYSVPVSAAGPGADVQISAALGSVTLARISPDSTRLVYVSDDNTLGRREIFSKPIAGGARIQLNPSMAGSGVRRIAISPDGLHVGYLADQNTTGVVEVYHAGIAAAGSGTRINVPMASGQFADTINISPDSSTILYEADQNTAGTHELFRSPMTGGSALLHGVTAPADVGFFGDLGTPVIGRRAVFPVFGSRIDVFTVPFDGSAPATQISTPPGAGDALFNVFLPGPAGRLMAYGLGPLSGTVTDEIRVAAVRGDLATTQINVTAASGARGVLAYEITSDERYGVYLQDRDTLGKPELYSREFDSDGDGIGNATDNCPFIANAAQGPVVFPFPVIALDSTTFSWGQPTEARFARGRVADVSSLTTDATGTVLDSATFTDTSLPPAGSAFWYLFAPHCAGRSWQTAIGAEPNRDLAGLP